MLIISIQVLLIFSILINSLLLYKVINFIHEVHLCGRVIRILDRVLIGIITAMNVINIAILANHDLMCEYLVYVFLLNMNYLPFMIFLKKFYNISCKRYGLC